MTIIATIVWQFDRRKNDRNTENMLSISFREHRDEEKENILLTFIIKM